MPDLDPMQCERCGADVPEAEDLDDVYCARCLLDHHDEVANLRAQHHAELIDAMSTMPYPGDH